MAVPEKLVCVLCGHLIDILIKDEAVYFLCGHIEHADCYLLKHPNDGICQKCGAESCSVTFKYVALLNRLIIWKCIRF